MLSDRKRAGERSPALVVVSDLSDSYSKSFPLFFPFRRHNPIIHGLLKWQKKFFDFEICIQHCTIFYSVQCEPNNSNPSSAATQKSPQTVGISGLRGFFRALPHPGAQRVFGVFVRFRWRKRRWKTFAQSAQHNAPIMESRHCHVPFDIAPTFRTSRSQSPQAPRAASKFIMLDPIQQNFITTSCIILSICV